MKFKRKQLIDIECYKIREELQIPFFTVYRRIANPAERRLREIKTLRIKLILLCFSAVNNQRRICRSDFLFLYL